MTTATKTSHYICIIITNCNYCYNGDKIKIITVLQKQYDVFLHAHIILYYILWSVEITNSQEILIRVVVIHMYEPTDDIIVKLKRNNIILCRIHCRLKLPSIRTDLKNAESLRSEFMATVLMRLILLNSCWSAQVRL